MHALVFNRADTRTSGQKLPARELETRHVRFEWLRPAGGPTPPCRASTRTRCAMFSYLRSRLLAPFAEQRWLCVHRSPVALGPRTGESLCSESFHADMNDELSGNEWLVRWFLHAKSIVKSTLSAMRQKSRKPQLTGDHSVGGIF